MNVEPTNVARSSPLEAPKNLEKIDTFRKLKESKGEDLVAEKKEIQPEELIDQIKNLTENGLYSVRFERDERVEQLVVKIVDRETDEMIRQVPAEELLELHEALGDLRGNIVDTQS